MAVVCDAYSAEAFCKIRHYGFLSSTWKRQKLKIVQLKMDVMKAERDAKGQKIRKCSCCKNGNLLTVLVFDKRGPPSLVLAGSHQIVSSKS